MKNFDSAAAGFLLAELHRDLKKTTNLEDIMPLRTRADVLRGRIKIARLELQILNRAAELKLLAERKMGKILPRFRLRGGNHMPSHAASRLTLDRLGIARRLSRQWQRVADLSEEDVADFVRQSSRRRREATSYGLFRLAEARAQTAKLARDDADLLGPLARGLRSLARRRRRFACIYVDAICAIVDKGRGGKGRQFDRRLAQLPVMELAAPVAHLYLKVTIGNFARWRGVKKEFFLRRSAASAGHLRRLSHFRISLCRNRLRYQARRSASLISAAARVAETTPSAIAGKGICLRSSAAFRE